MPSQRTSEAAFETAIESVLLAGGYVRVDGNAFDRCTSARSQKSRWMWCCQSTAFRS